MAEDDGRWITAVLAADADLQALRVERPLSTPIFIS